MRVLETRTTSTVSLHRGLGATYLGDDRCRFLAWAPFATEVEIHIVRPVERLIAMDRGERGYHHATVGGVPPGTSYLYRLGGQKERPDPASRFQPDGVHGPSQVVDPHAFHWEDRCWFGIPLQNLLIYELHVGTFTREGTFEAVIARLDDLRDLGITAVELMPVAQFPGTRNWGYDAVYPFAVQNSYGGPDGLRRLIDACHLHGLAAILDVIYNPLGPEGNYLADFAPYFTDRYRTPWGQAINFDGPGSDEVRRFFIENALYWFDEFHADALRLDAIHAIVDSSAYPFLAELAATTHREVDTLNRRVYLIAESDLNDARIIRPPELGGFGLDAQWSDDFHHALHVLMTGEQAGYYRDFGGIAHLAKALREGFVYTGQCSLHRGRRHGNSPVLNDARQFVVCSQNHDQVGNRMLGERLAHLVPFDALKLAAGVVLLSPFVPLLFMGEEYAETAPFLYFTSHADEALVEAVRQGRREEFASFQWAGEVPDPQAESTFDRSRLDHGLKHQLHHRVLRGFYKELIRLRKELPPLAYLDKGHLDVIGYENAKSLFVRRWTETDQAFAVFNFGEPEATLSFPLPAGRWRRQIDSSEKRWLGGGSAVPALLRSQGEAMLTVGPKAFAVFALVRERTGLREGA